MSSVDRAAPANDNALAEPGQAHVRRLALAVACVSGLFLIVAALVLQSAIQTQERTVDHTRRTAGYLTGLAALRDLANVASARDGLVVRDAASVSDATRRAAAHADFRRASEQLRADIARGPHSSETPMLTIAVNDIGEAVDTMILVADRSIERAGLSANAAPAWDDLDRAHLDVNHAILEAMALGHAIHTAALDRQLEATAHLRSVQTVVGALCLLILASSAVYSASLRRTAQTSERRRVSAVAGMEAARTSLRHYAENLAHELRSPIGKMLVESEIVLSRPRSIEEYRDALASSMDECRGLKRIVESLLLLARLEHAGASLETPPTDVSSELSRAEAFFARAARERGVTLTVTCAPGLSFPLDGALFQRALSNVIANAIAHTGQGGRVEVKASVEGDILVVNVADTGEGIPAGEQVRIFDRYVRRPPVMGDHERRVGLGLPIAKSIVALHGGVIDLASEVGKGTNVTFKFPATRA